MLVTHTIAAHLGKLEQSGLGKSLHQMNDRRLVNSGNLEGYSSYERVCLKRGLRRAKSYGKDYWSRAGSRVHHL
jgi:hypothetical protein